MSRQRLKLFLFLMLTFDSFAQVPSHWDHRRGDMSIELSGSSQWALDYCNSLGTLVPFYSADANQVFREYQGAGIISYSGTDHWDLSLEVPFKLLTQNGGSEADALTYSVGDMHFGTRLRLYENPLHLSARFDLGLPIYKNDSDKKIIYAGDGQTDLGFYLESAYFGNYVGIKAEGGYVFRMSDFEDHASAGLDVVLSYQKLTMEIGADGRLGINNLNDQINLNPDNHFGMHANNANKKYLFGHVRASYEILNKTVIGVDFKKIIVASNFPNLYNIGLTLKMNFKVDPLTQPNNPLEKNSFIETDK